jgi:hypothetical protein
MVFLTTTKTKFCEKKGPWRKKYSQGCRQKNWQVAWTNNKNNMANDQECNRLKQELQQTKLKEEQLSQKIRELGKKPVQIQEKNTSFSF